MGLWDEIRRCTTPYPRASPFPIHGAGGGAAHAITSVISLPPYEVRTHGEKWGRRTPLAARAREEKAR